MLRIIFLCGEICSGKNYYYENVMPTQEWDRIIVSDIVRKLISSGSRSALQSTADLDEQIAHIIMEKMKVYNGRGKLVIDGIRQASIIKYVEEMMIADYGYIWLDVAYEKRKERFEARITEKDKDTSFEDADRRDIDLGIRHLQAFLRVKRTEQTLIEKR